jgi:hypothetical protein
MFEHDTTTAKRSVPKTAMPALRARRSFRAYIWACVVGALLLFGLYTVFMLWWSYSEGERAGVLQKFSKRGWVCKTYEGELALYVVGGIAPQIWHFSVRDPEVAEQLHKVVGQQVRVHYTEHPGLPTSCFGETDYFADGFESMASPPVAQPSSGLNIMPAPASAMPGSIDPKPATNAPVTSGR